MRKVVDFHTHVLPQIDDGSGSVKESLEMLRMEGTQGVRRVVATPHFYAQVDSVKSFLERRSEAVSRLREAMEGVPGLPRLSVGAEVHYFSGISEAGILPELAIDNGRFVLVELPMRVWTDKMYQELEDIHGNFGLIPIVAHVDRYIGPLQTYGIPERLAELPVIVQANAGFFQRLSTRALALRMLEKGQIHLLGSDCHNMKDRPVNIRAAIDLIEKKLGPGAVTQLNACERWVLSGGSPKM